MKSLAKYLLLISAALMLIPVATDAQRRGAKIKPKKTAHNSEEELAKAKELFDAYAFDEAIKQLEMAIEKGKKAEAARLLNSVRRRNYPAENLQEVLYVPEGNAELDMDEMLDEWGREFFAESRRRIDLIRFGKFSSGTWWDKTPDADSHTEIFPIMRSILNANRSLHQNPGYND